MVCASIGPRHIKTIAHTSIVFYVEPVGDTREGEDVSNETWMKPYRAVTWEVTNTVGPTAAGITKDRHRGVGGPNVGQQRLVAEDVNGRTRIEENPLVADAFLVVLGGGHGILTK